MRRMTAISVACFGILQTYKHRKHEQSYKHLDPPAQYDFQNEMKTKSHYKMSK